MDLDRVAGMSRAGTDPLFVAFAGAESVVGVGAAATEGGSDLRGGLLTIAFLKVAGT